MRGCTADQFLTMTMTAPLLPSFMGKSKQPRATFPLSHLQLSLKQLLALKFPFLVRPLKIFPWAALLLQPLLPKCRPFSFG